MFFSIAIFRFYVFSASFALQSKAVARITGPPLSLTHFVGENAHVKWNSSDNSTIFSATWGIRKGNIADPQFIHVNILSNKININSDLKPDLISRLSFDGDLRKGQAWFVLKNVTVNDTNEYIASISDDGTRVLPYTVVLTVKRRETKENKSAIAQITGPPRSLTHFVGENAHFKWNSTDNSTLFSAIWGIRKGSMSDPPFINVNILSNKTNRNSDLKPDLISRISFDGDLRKGQAWFVLKNVTVNDTNEYLASISDDGTRVLSCTVVLTVKGRETKENTSEKTTKQHKQPNYQAVTSTLPPRFETSMKDPKKPEFSNVDLSVIIALCALAVLIAVIVLVVVAFLKRRQVCKKGIKNSNKTSSSIKLLKV